MSFWNLVDFVCSSGTTWTLAFGRTSLRKRLITEPCRKMSQRDREPIAQRPWADACLSREFNQSISHPVRKGEQKQRLAEQMYGAKHSRHRIAFCTILATRQMLSIEHTSECCCSSRLSLQCYLAAGKAYLYSIGLVIAGIAGAVAVLAED